MGCVKGVKFAKWNSEEDNFLIKNYGKLSYTEMMEKLGRTRNSVKNRITVLSRKGFIAKSAREEMAKRSQFKSGHDSWNKGMCGTCKKRGRNK